MTKRLALLSLFSLMAVLAFGRHQIKSDNIKTLQVVVNSDWLSMPIMQLGSDDVLHIAFDEMSHNYHRFVAHIEHCEADWSPSSQLFENDWLEGFNDVVIDDYENSLNTTVLYTHYRLELPNEQCRLKMSGNYRIHVIDEDEDGKEVLVAEFRVAEQLMNVGMSVVTNTDLDFNNRYQQVSISLSYNNIRVSNPAEQLQVLVLQNGREDNMKVSPHPNYVMPTGLRWEHNRDLIFEGGNEYHKFEVLDPTHTTLGLDRVWWDEEQRYYHAMPFPCVPQLNYLYTEDADGAFYIRNSDNFENDRTTDYVYVHYKLVPAPLYDSEIVIEGQWTNGHPDSYTMYYDEDDHSYNAVVLQKMGYYNYQLLMVDADGTTHRVPEEGSFYQTENRYTVLAYYRGNGERTWRLVAWRTHIFRP
jgi:hypothetical protein